MCYNLHLGRIELKMAGSFHYHGGGGSSGSHYGTTNPALDLLGEGAVDDDRSSVNNNSQGGELNRTDWKEHASKTMEEYLLNCPRGSSNSGRAAAEQEEPPNMVAV